MQAKNPCSGGILEAMVHFGAVGAHARALVPHLALLGLSHRPGPSAAGAQPQRAGSSSSAVQEGEEEEKAVQLPVEATAQHGADTTAVPPWAEPAPPPGAVVMAAGGGRDVARGVDRSAVGGQGEEGSEGARVKREVCSGVEEEDVTEVLAAAERVALLREEQAVPRVPSGEVQEGGGAEEPLAQQQHRRALVREWAWAFGRALARQLSTGWFPSADGWLPAQSSLSLFVTNSCEVLPEADAGPAAGVGEASVASEAAPSAGGEAEREVELRAEAVRDLAAHDPGAMEAHAWIDGVSVREVRRPQQEGGVDDAAATGRFRVSFTVSLAGHVVNRCCCWMSRLRRAGANTSNILRWRARRCARSRGTGAATRARPGGAWPRAPCASGIPCPTRFWQTA